MGRGVDGIDVAENKYKWRNLVNMLMNLRGPYMTGNFLPIWGTVKIHKDYAQVRQLVT